MTRKHGSLSDKKREAAIATMKESAKKQCPHKQASEHEMVSYEYHEPRTRCVTSVTCLGESETIAWKTWCSTSLRE